MDPRSGSSGRIGRGKLPLSGARLLYYKGRPPAASQPRHGTPGSETAGGDPGCLWSQREAGCNLRYTNQPSPHVEILGERHHKDVLTRHRQQSWYIPGVILRKIGQDVYAVQVEDNKILDRDHTQIGPRAPDPSRQAVTFDFTAGDLDPDDDGEEDDDTVERILMDKPDHATPGGKLYKVRWKRFALSRDSWEPPSSFVPSYTTVWLDYLKKKGISLDVKDVLVHLIMHERD